MDTVQELDAVDQPALLEKSTSDLTKGCLELFHLCLAAEARKHTERVAIEGSTQNERPVVYDSKHKELPALKYLKTVKRTTVEAPKHNEGL